MIRLFLASIAALLVFASTALASVPGVYARAKPAAHRLEMSQGWCSATAVGPHVLLTAAHCFQGHPPTSVEVDGVVAEVVSITEDGSDHALIRLSITFKAWARVRKTPLVQGEDVFLWGNPADIQNMLRRGYYAGPYVMEGQPICLFILPTSNGDSGGGLFDASGLLITAHTGGIVLPDGQRFQRSMPLAFTREDWTKAAK